LEEAATIVQPEWGTWGQRDTFQVRGHLGGEQKGCIPGKMNSAWETKGEEGTRLCWDTKDGYVWVVQRTGMWVGRGTSPATLGLCLREGKAEVGTC
jgi:hypothetical protein